MLPGLVDTHVHVNEPGRTDWEGFDTATRRRRGRRRHDDRRHAAQQHSGDDDASPALAEKREAAQGQCRVDVAFWGGVVPGNAGELDALVDAGVRGFKCFLAPSGVDEFPAVDEPDLACGASRFSRGARVPLLVHAELPAHG